MTASTTPSIDFGIELARRRTESGLTQQGLAQHLRTNRVTVNRWEAGRNMPDEANLALLATLFPELGTAAGVLKANWRDLMAAARKMRRLTFGQLGTLLSVQPATVSMWEGGLSMPRLNHIQRLETVLQINLRQTSDAGLMKARRARSAAVAEEKAKTRSFADEQRVSELRYSLETCIVNFGLDTTETMMRKLTIASGGFDCEEMVPDAGDVVDPEIDVEWAGIDPDEMDVMAASSPYEKAMV